MMKSLRRLLIVIACVLASYESNAQSTMTSMPDGAYEQYFKYYTPGVTPLQQSLQPVPKGVIGIEGGLHYGSSGSLHPQGGTGFLIRTFRNDNKICFCTAKHVLSQAQLIGDEFELDGYWKYYGQPDPDAHQNNQVLTGYHSAFVGEVVSDIDEDAVLLLIDKEDIPVANYSMLGYDFAVTLPADAKLATFHHPQGMTMRIADSLGANTVRDRGYFDDANETEFYTASPPGRNYISVGSSGSPLVNRDPNNSSVVGIVTAGIISAGMPEMTIDDDEYVGHDANIIFDGEQSSVKIRMLEAAIKYHCWKNRTEQDLLLSGDYKKTLIADNSAFLDHYTMDRTVTSTASLQSLRDADYTTYNPGSTLVAGLSISASGNIDPTGDADLQKIYFKAPQISCDNTFSYTASGDQELYISVVTLEPTAATSRLLEDASQTDTISDVRGTTPALEQALAVSVYPNPSATGLFSIDLNDHSDGRSGDYFLQVYAANGTMILQEPVGGINQTQTLNISSQPKGTYLLVIRNQRGHVLSRKLLTY